MLQLAPGTTSQSYIVEIYDDAGLPVTGLVAATFPTVKGLRNKEAVISFPSLSDLAALNSAFTAGGVKEYANGRYRLDGPDSLLATASDEVRIIGEATDKRLFHPPIQVTPLVAPRITGFLALNIKTTAGTTVEFQAGIRADGRFVNLDSADPSATCEITVYIEGSDIALFTLDTTDCGAPTSKGTFEVEQADPGFTADRGHIAIATITYLGTAYLVELPFVPVP